MKKDIHSKEAWLNQKHKPVFKKKASKDLYRDRIDKDGLSWEDRKRINEIKEAKSREESVDPLEEI